jgi:cell division protein FtsW (lipid II flippase)
VVAVWCFLHDRFVWAGIVCLAASLAIKPHDAGLVWLYFLLAGGVYRKRALQVLVVTAVIGLAAIVWVTPIAPHWMQEWQSNLLAESVPGGPSNPGPTNASCSGPGMIIDLQAVMSVFRDDPRIYNPASYLLCGALLLTWSVRTLRSRFSQARAWIALAAVVPLTMVVTYHRSHDAKLLLLAVPACAMLWAEGRPIRWVALVASSAAIVCTADIPLTILLTLTRNLHISTVGISGKMLTVVLTRPVPLILLAMSIFYLWIYMRRTPERGLP